ncbi:Sperm-specific class P protein 31 [Toxocara canis]|uniref:Major sperm protein n=1 Tax=Toxocara canis TaxID=6265 RepID=A0A0B2VPU5_TOXCA|nr:Sperm-specific class P protein 31 [Toxocara canis]
MNRTSLRSRGSVFMDDERDQEKQTNEKCHERGNRETSKKNTNQRISMYLLKKTTATMVIFDFYGLFLLNLVAVLSILLNITVQCVKKRTKEALTKTPTASTPQGAEKSKTGEESCRKIEDPKKDKKEKSDEEAKKKEGAIEGEEGEDGKKKDEDGAKTPNKEKKSYKEDGKNKDENENVQKENNKEKKSVKGDEEKENDGEKELHKGENDKKDNGSAKEKDGDKDHKEEEGNKDGREEVENKNKKGERENAEAAENRGNKEKERKREKSANREKNEVGNKIPFIPREVHLAAQGDSKKITLMNNTGKRQALKVKCSDNTLYRINPVYAFLEQDAMTEVEVTRLPGIAKTDKVIILCIAAEAASTDPKSLFVNAKDTCIEHEIPLLVP